MKCARRHLVKIVLLLTGGAIINIAVAWGCALWAIPAKQLGDGVHRVTAPIQSKSHPQWFEPRSLQSHPMYLRSETYAPGLTLTQTSIYELFHGAQVMVPDRIVHESCAGWPTRSLESIGLIEWQGVGPMTVEKWEYGCAAAPALRPQTIRSLFFGPYASPLPLRPVWPGFAINTLLYAIILWTLFALPFAWRRRRRISRGLCAACGYPVGMSDVCTKCGRPVRSQSS
jgi:hypothetical protein